MRITLTDIRMELIELNLKSGYRLVEANWNPTKRKLTWNIGTYYLNKNDLRASHLHLFVKGWKGF